MGFRVMSINIDLGCGFPPDQEMEAPNTDMTHPSMWKCSVLIEHMRNSKAHRSEDSGHSKDNLLLSFQRESAAQTLRDRWYRVGGWLAGLALLFKVLKKLCMDF